MVDVYSLSMLTFVRSETVTLQFQEIFWQRLLLLWHFVIYTPPVLFLLVISRSGFEGVLPFPEAIFPQITYSRSSQNPILKISNFPANSGKVRYPKEKAPSAYITRRPERESAILVDPPRAKALGHQLRDIPLDFVSWISSAIFPWRERYRQIAPSPARVDVLYIQSRKSHVYKGAWYFKWRYAVPVKGYQQTLTERQVQPKIYNVRDQKMY